MPAKSSTTFHIVFNCGDLELFKHMSLQLYKDILFSKLDIVKYVICGEMEAFPHYHAAVVLATERKQDKIKQQLLPLFRRHMESQGFKWEDKNDLVALKVNYHPDINCLAGGYCTKDMIGGMISHGFTEEELSQGKTKYGEKMESKKKKIPVSRSGLLPLMKEVFSKLWVSICVDTEKMEKYDKFSPEKKMDLLNSLILADGYDTSVVYGTLQWKAITKNFDVIFLEHDEETVLRDYGLD